MRGPWTGGAAAVAAVAAAAADGRCVRQDCAIIGRINVNRANETHVRRLERRPSSTRVDRLIATSTTTTTTAAHARLGLAGVSAGQQHERASVRDIIINGSSSSSRRRQRCEDVVEITAKRPPETSPKVARLAVFSVDYRFLLLRMQLSRNKFEVSEH